LLAASFALGACVEEPPPVVAPPPPLAAIVRPDEKHLPEVHQITFGGDNGEPRWSWASDQLVFEARGPEDGCDRVYRLDPFAEHATPTPLSSGQGATSGPSFLPGDKDVLFASTHLAGRACPPRPDHAKGDVWAVPPTYDLFRARADGSDVTRLTETPGYDAEGAVCGKDGSIVFTSARDGDLDLYRMDADGGNVRRLTGAAGYDGGAAFDADCTHILWRASRPKGKDLDDYKALLAENLVRKARLELWIASADGTDAAQVTYLDATAFAPAWQPSQKRVLFASSYEVENPRDLDLWAIDVEGTGLERVTTAPGLDAAPAFSPDGKWLAFSSSRATLLGRHDHNLFVARWSDGRRTVEERPADHLMGDAAWLADKAREGRGVGSKGLDDAGAYVERSFKSIGLSPAGDDGYRQAVELPDKVSGVVSLAAGGVTVDAGELRAIGFSASTEVAAPMFFVGSEDDYAKIDAKGKIAVVRGVGVGSLRHRASLARERGAVCIVVIAEAGFPELVPQRNEGIAAAMVSLKAFGPILTQLQRGLHPLAKLGVTLAPETTPGFNVAGRWPAAVPPDQKLPGVVVVGAHYDHLGLGGGDSLAPESHEPHPGADDDASGIAALLEVGRLLVEKKASLRRDVLLVAFTGEELGAVGSGAFVKHPPGGLEAKDVVAMVNLDMVGRLRDNSLQVFGSDTATEWPELLSSACGVAGVECERAAGGGFGAMDHLPFYAAGIPVLHLFTGVHGDYHKPSDTADKLNAGGMAQVAVVAEQLARDLAELSARPSYVHLASPPPAGDVRRFAASLGTIPDYAGPAGGQKGMLLAGVRPGGPADQAGLRKGDVVVRLGRHIVGNVEDVMFVLTEARPGTVMKVVVLREGKELAVDVTLQESGRSR
jgi:Tol biopolymer transport system component